MDKVQLGIRVTTALATNLKESATQAKLSVNEYVSRQLETAADNSLGLKERLNFPTISAIYFVTDEIGQILYIGRAKNLRQRWAQHHRFRQLNQMGIVTISWFECEESKLEEIESILIEILKPQLNRQEIPNIPPANKKEEGARDLVLKIRVNQKEWDAISAKAKEDDITNAEAIRNYIRSLIWYANEAKSENGELS